MRHQNAVCICLQTKVFVTFTKLPLNAIEKNINIVEN